VRDHERTETDTPEDQRRAPSVATRPRLDAPQAADGKNDPTERSRAGAHRDRKASDQRGSGDRGCGDGAHRPSVARRRRVSANPTPDIIYGINSPAELVRSTRERLGLSQRRLALRAGTTQAAISRIERGLVSPTFTTLRELMIAMGEEPVLSTRRLPTNWDPAHMASTLARTPEERLTLALSWNRMAGRLAEAGRQAREDD
jgi:transcriptional regulator with XRE-family HTH domain